MIYASAILESSTIRKQNQVEYTVVEESRAEELQCSTEFGLSQTNQKSVLVVGGQGSATSSSEISDVRREYPVHAISPKRAKLYQYALHNSAYQKKRSVAFRFSM